MLARLSAATVVGIDAVPVSVEVDVASGGLPGMTVVGLPDATVRESRDRVRSAIRNTGFPSTGSRIIVSLTPSDVRKVGTAFDLPIALGMLTASGVLPYHQSPPMLIVGGLALDGRILPMRGLLPIAAHARRLGIPLMFPADNLAEAGIVEGLPLLPVASLGQAVRALLAPSPTIATGAASAADAEASDDDLADVRGQLLGRRALEVAAAGGHHLLLSGPPGAGKTMLARRLPGLLPPLAFDEALVVTTVHSVAGTLPSGSGLITTRPFRAPHHTASDIALVGGGSVPRPGEISLAHHGVLFLDELPEFSRHTLETLRQPLELGSVTIARAGHSATFPARVMLVGAMNPCPCGFAGSPSMRCRCGEPGIERYQRRLSGPLLDRFDLRVEIPAVPWSDLQQAGADGEATAAVRERVIAARARQLRRQSMLNAGLEGRLLRQLCRLPEPSSQRLVGRAVSRLGLSVRGVSRVLRVARTIADLAGDDAVRTPYVAEALHFRGATNTGPTPP